VTRAKFQQLVNGIEVYNGMAHVTVDRDGKIVSSANSFYLDVPPKSPTTDLASLSKSAIEAVIAFAKHIKVEVPPDGRLQADDMVDGVVRVIGAAFAGGPLPIKQMYFHVEGWKLESVWNLTARVDKQL